MGKTIRNYDRDGLKGMKIVKKSKPRKKHIVVDDYIYDDDDYLNDLENKSYDEMFPDMYSE